MDLPSTPAAVGARNDPTMHDSAFEKAQVIRSADLAELETTPLDVLDLGSAVVADGHRSNREAFANPHRRYVGLDIEAGPNVDVVVAEPDDWREVADGSFDVVCCSPVFEHTQFFWITILEIARVLRPNGLALIVAPGSGPLHRYPVDCWRFYDDGLPALAEWADLAVVEARMQWRPVYRKGDQWRDAAALLQRPVRDPAREARALASSALGPASGRDALARHEDTLLARRSALAHEASAVGRHLRAIRDVVSKPAGWGAGG